MKSLDIYDYSVIVAYLLFMLGIGFYFMRVSKGGKDFFAGGNMIPWWVSGMSLFMTNFSAWIFTGGAGFAYSVGWFALPYFIVGAIGYYVGTLLTAKQWRRTRSISPIEYTRTRFNVSTQQLVGWVISINFILSAGVQLSATSILMAPVLQFDSIVLVAIVLGTVILAYSFMGGLWAVTVTDTLQGIIVLAIAFVVVPASLYLVGGFDTLVDKLPAITFDHLYNGVHYDTSWLVAMLMITSIGFAAGGAQRFYAVKDEKDARRVGYFAAALGALGPLVFGIPPLVAKVIWPNLADVEFFKPYLNSNPQDLVYFGVCLKILPNGLIGVFLAAMLAATMSTLSSVYNLVSSIFTRDVYQALFKPETTDEQLLKIGRIASLGSGFIVIGLAVVFVTSKLGIFNLMQAFFTLFNVPVVVPTAFGLLFRRVPRWSAFASIIWGLVIGATTRYLVHWDMGPQVFLAFAMTFGIFAGSYWFGRLYVERKLLLVFFSAWITAVLILLYATTGGPEMTGWNLALAIASAVATGSSLPYFSKLFAMETPEQREIIDEFFKKLDTPIDVAREVFGAGKKQVSTFPLVGGTVVVMGLLMGLIFFTEMPKSESIILGILISLMIVVGVVIWYFGRKSEIRNIDKYLETQEK